MNDDLMTRLAQARPPTEPGWAESGDGQQTLTRVIRNAEHGTSSRRRVRRPGTVLACLVGFTAVAGTAAATLASREANTTDQVGCYETLDPQANVTGLTTTTGDFVAACRRIWPEGFGTAAPSDLVVCVNSAGGRGVYPAPRGMSERDACAKIDALPEG